MKAKECMVSSSDDWSPSFDGGLVELSLSKLNTGNYRIAVFGADDMGMNLDTNDINKACKIYQKIKSLNDVTIKRLLNLGFDSF